MRGSFSEKIPSYSEKIIEKVLKYQERVDKIIESKMNSAVKIVWATAHAKRPMITKAQSKSEGRLKRVSDPGATAGVPVDTGDLQISIKKDVTKKGFKLIGRIYVEGPGEKYANFMEFGTSKTEARPFMRPALNLNKEFIKQIFRKSDTNK